MKTLCSPALKDIRLTDPVLRFRQERCFDSTIPAVIAQTLKSGRIQAFALKWKEGMPDKPHIFWDSDVAKVMEGMAYTLALSPDPDLEKIYEEWVDLICSAQQPDGYLNVYFTIVEPEKRFANLMYDHELYCAGHLIEAAVAGYEALGKRKLLDCLCRYADYLCSVFGYEEGKRRGWPGHEEIELALAKLYRVTRKENYLKLLQYFINDRGTSPNFYVESEGKNSAALMQVQAVRPVREQKKAEGHAVRQIYLACGMADLAALDQDESLLTACRELYDNITLRQMYVTGGIGSCFAQERFTVDYDLTNGNLMYAESCAAMGLAFFAWRMYNVTGETKYMDTVERCLYNGILSGIGLCGDKFFYANYLEMDENHSSRFSRTREPWFDCACCPTSFARFIPQFGRFLYSVDPTEELVMINIPAANHAELELNGRKIVLDIAGKYPYDGMIKITVGTSGRFALQPRIPGWCGKYSLCLNGKLQENWCIRRDWNAGDVLELDLEMPPEWIYSHPKVTSNSGRVAIMRGPLVYALEEIDQNVPVRSLILKTSSPLKIVSSAFEILKDVPVLEGVAESETFPDESLYSTQPPIVSTVTFRAIPYALWQNRGDTNMAVWMRRS
ncbi:MAG: glycoside hydrolase family 127 protein [Lentisphaeria bacterium]|nr:glycoside hydrolase family 127 protein [Lentisphaeria bacterium]